MNPDLRRNLNEAISLAAQGFWDELEELIEAKPTLATHEDEHVGYLLVRLSRFAGSARAIRLALTHGAKVNFIEGNGSSALTEAIEGGSTYGLTTLPELLTLLDAGADVNKVDKSGYPPLHWAIVMNRLEHAKVLMEHGANPYLLTADLNPETALDVARRVGNKRAIELLESWKVKKSD